MNRCDLIGPVYLGSSLDQTGLLSFFNSSSLNATAFQAGNATAAITYTWPTAAPAGNNYILGATTAGVLSWINAPGIYAPLASPTFTGTVIISGDIFTVDYTDYSAISTITGWSSFTSKVLYYKKIGKLMFVWWDLRGTSNATTVTFTLPFTAANTVSHRICADTTDNGTRTTTGGEGVLPGNTATLQVYKDMSQATWTNSGTKETMGMIFYQTT